ncbi:hypothetical protein CE91St56_36410 [Lachnospiraceae bacterium]|nr:hypothetical protein CE91St56_36410 [Lachnospiraceae bacterium]GKH42589.1 hypothetical protein CE91St57_35630 [Lachnospiraceae bacterium]
MYLRETADTQERIRSDCERAGVCISGANESGISESDTNTSALNPLDRMMGKNYND